MIITSPRLVLRPWQRRDLDALADLPPYPDPLDDDWNWPHALRANGTADFFFLGRSCDPNRAEWTITLPSEQIIGHLGIRDIDRDTRSRDARRVRLSQRAAVRRCPRRFSAGPGVRHGALPVDESRYCRLAPDRAVCVRSIGMTSRVLSMDRGAGMIRL